MTTGTFSQNICKLFSSSTNNLSSLILCSSQLRSHWKYNFLVWGERGANLLAEVENMAALQLCTLGKCRGMLLQDFLVVFVFWGTFGAFWGIQNIHTELLEKRLIRQFIIITTRVYTKWMGLGKRLWELLPDQHTVSQARSNQPQHELLSASTNKRTESNPDWSYLIWLERLSKGNRVGQR